MLPRHLILGVLALAMVGCTANAPGGPPLPAKDPAAEARDFLKTVDETMLRLGRESNQAAWVSSTYITPDTEALNARANQVYIEAVAKFAKDAVKFNDAKVSPDERRQLDLLKLSLVMVTPSNPAESEELTKLAAGMEGAYGRGKWCGDTSSGDTSTRRGGSSTFAQGASADKSDPPGTCLDVEAITQIMAENRDPKRLREVWEGWHTISPPYRKDYARFVGLANKGAKELGFADTGAMWRAKYDMPADAFTQELDRLWEQVRPLYVSLHAYVRMKLHQRYGEVVPSEGPIPAYLLGNIWAQDWSNIFPLVAPANADPGYDIGAILEARHASAVDIARTGERFFTSLGFAPLPQTFWERSLLVKPRDRDVVCHASAWDIDLVEDVRIKMCIDPTTEDFVTIHHELGHNFYQRAYDTLPVIFRDSANDGFHEAIGDTIALSVTPEYLVKIGMLPTAPDASRDIGLLLHKALEKIAFLPFGLLIDQWRCQVFSGQIPPDKYNEAWWALRLKYQGIAPPSPRGEDRFDAGAKYHVPANTPYARYFLAGILQFQFHRALAQAAGCQGPLHRCSIYDSTAAGTKLNTMLALGLSKPWPDALEALTGSRQMDAGAIRDYFAPLQAWLDAQLQGQPTGW